MRRFGAAGLVAAALALPLEVVTAQVRGVVLDVERNPIAGAEIAVGTFRATAGADGRFRLDRVPNGRYTLTARFVGYHPSRMDLELPSLEAGNLQVFLIAAPAILPPLVVEGRRTGLYGVVGDTAMRPALGAHIQLMGRSGGEALTDSMGRFAFPEAKPGDYLLRITLPGYQERRFSVTIEPDRGKEVTALLAPVNQHTRASGNAELVALRELERRLAWSVDRNVLTSEELARYGSMPLCDIPELRVVVGSAPWGIVDGWRTYYNACAWRADEVELVEWGGDFCREPTGTLREMFRATCAELRGRFGRRITDRGYLLIWSRK